MTVQIPTITSWSEFREISFYDFLALKECPLKAMSKNLNTSSELPALPPTKSALLGKFYHKLMELVTKSGSRQALEEAIESEITRLQHQVNQWPHLKSGSVSGWDEVNYYAVIALKDFSKLSNKKSSTYVGSEKKLVSKDGLLIGRPDFFTISNGEAYLRELKTSSLKDKEGKIKHEYDEQLVFYSVLLYDNFEIQLVRGSLASPRSEKYERVITKDEAALYRVTALQQISQWNTKIKAIRDATQLSILSKSACNMCVKKYVCRPFKENQFKLELTNDGYVLEGKIQNISDYYSTVLSVVSVCDKYSEETKTLLIPKLHIANLSLHRTYLFSELLSQGSSLHWSNRSMVFRCD